MYSLVNYYYAVVDGYQNNYAANRFITIYLYMKFNNILLNEMQPKKMKIM